MISISWLLAASLSAAAPVQAVSVDDAARQAVSISEARHSIIAPCLAAKPVVGSEFSGPVLQVVDAQTLCVALGTDPSQWVQVRLPRGQRAETRGDLMAASFARNITCRTLRRAQEGVIAACALDGENVGRLTRTRAVKAAGLDWR
ncbi:hypothetical protein P7B02_01735 [Caulobacter segnis]|uniref:hypothetical protein n=1 Tax=Caulobacter segnis TaxID=88688 RepID=UPI00240EB2B4|nr:hypothetical protein [Caulobacter segnis]MDG2520245.1 hypothetical protein [Caulobacter segnis]